jgi:hypothetical protein
MLRARDIFTTMPHDDLVKPARNSTNSIRALAASELKTHYNPQSSMRPDRMKSYMPELLHR